MSLPELHVYPIVTAVIFPLTFVLTYTIAVLLNHTEFDWPYISDTAAYPPGTGLYTPYAGNTNMCGSKLCYQGPKYLRETTDVNSLLAILDDKKESQALLALVAATINSLC